MKDVKKHICPTCGGNLFVNIERQMYECPFCGVTYDYDYFREESVLGLAAQALKDNEFASAGRAYDFMLEKEPDNFEALRGKALIAMNIPEIAQISRIDLFSEINYESAYKEIDRAIGSSKPQDREYFTIMKDIVDAGHEYIDEKAGLEIHRTERKKLLHKRNEFIVDRDSLFIYTSAKKHPKRAVILTVICYMLCCLIIFLGYKYSTRNPYAKAEDLSRYETIQTEVSDSRTVFINSYGYNNTDFNGFAEYYSNRREYEKALEREMQRKINYETWEENHKDSYSNLIWILGIATVIYALIVFFVFKGGRDLDKEISKIQARADERTGKIKSSEERMAQIEDRIGQDYKRLCEIVS